MVVPLRKPAPSGRAGSHSPRNGPHTRSRITKGPERQTFQQCNGEVVAWNGRVHHIKIDPH